MALVHDNVDPTLTAISIGGTVSSAGVWLFAPESTGLVNRDFSAVSAEGGQTPAPFPGRLLISLNNDTEMLVERQDGDCTDVTRGLVERQDGGLHRRRGVYHPSALQQVDAGLNSRCRYVNGGNGL